jgi:hypothetical protein
MLITPLGTLCDAEKIPRIFSPDGYKPSLEARGLGFCGLMKNAEL